MAGKKFSLKSSSSAGKQLPTYRKVSASSSGGSARESQHTLAPGAKRGPEPGKANARHYSLKPNGNSGTTGHAQPLKSFRKISEQAGSDNPIRRETKTAKPKR